MNVAKKFRDLLTWVTMSAVVAVVVDGRFQFLPTRPAVLLVMVIMVGAWVTALAQVGVWVAVMVRRFRKSPLREWVQRMEASQPSI